MGRTKPVASNLLSKMNVISNFFYIIIKCAPRFYYSCGLILKDKITVFSLFVFFNYFIHFKYLSQQMKMAVATIIFKELDR